METTTTTAKFHCNYCDNEVEANAPTCLRCGKQFPPPWGEADHNSFEGSTNVERAGRAESVADIYSERYDMGEPLNDVATDLLADLMHLCRREGIDFDNQLRIARDHHDEEVRGVREAGEES